MSNPAQRYLDSLGKIKSPSLKNPRYWHVWGNKAARVKTHRTPRQERK